MAALVVGSLAALVVVASVWLTFHRVDPPYRGLHRPGAGRHRLPDWHVSPGEDQL